MAKKKKVPVVPGLRDITDDPSVYCFVCGTEPSTCGPEEVFAECEEWKMFKTTDSVFVKPELVEGVHFQTEANPWTCFTRTSQWLSSLQMAFYYTHE